MGGKERLENREQAASLINVLKQRFIQRSDLYAIQITDGSYICVHEPLRESHLLAHLEGEMTLGAYVLDKNSEGHFMILDADDEPDWRRLQALSSVLAKEGTASYLERSRRGGHLWLFFSRRLPGRDIRLFGNGLLRHFGIRSVEMYPKQDELTTGPGSLMRLPFGIHRKSGRRYGFYFPDGKPLARTLRAQILLLRGAETVQKGVFEHFAAYAEAHVEEDRSRESERPRKTSPPPAEEAPVSERIKAAITVRDFVGQYVELSEDGKGLCPFHDDHVESFSVNEEGNYWYCFACDMGGSVIDFWMQWRQCEFVDALTELADILLS